MAVAGTRGQAIGQGVTGDELEDEKTLTTIFADGGVISQWPSVERVSIELVGDYENSMTPVMIVRSAVSCTDSRP